MAQFNGRDSVPLWLDGEQVTGSRQFEVVSPVTNEALYTASAAGPEDVDKATKSAQQAFETWSQTKPGTRRTILLKAADELERRKTEIQKYSAGESGAQGPMLDFDWSNAVDHCRTVAGLLGSVNEGYVPNVGEADRNAMVLREPYGVTLGIAPWNAPMILGWRAVLAAIAMGNTVIFKVSEGSPGVHWALVDILYAAGLPKGVVNTIAHRPQDGPEIIQRLVEAPEIKKISFTGSTMTGSKIAAMAGKNLKPTIMELGGKAPTIVCEDANLEQAALGSVLGAFMYGGQICMATERILVHQSIYEKFKPILKGTLEAVFGQDEDGFPLINSNGPIKNKQLLEDAISKGAKVVHGDPTHNSKSSNAMKPVILEHVREGMDIYHTESFGPTVSLFAVETDDEAIRIANDTDYGLAASVYTEDFRRGLKIAKAIETGAVHINNMSVHDESVLPHGGAKKSGWGRFNGRQGLEEWVRTKVVTWK